MKTDSYSRKISTKETRKRFIFILKNKLNLNRLAEGMIDARKGTTCRKGSSYQNLKLSILKIH